MKKILGMIPTVSIVLLIVAGMFAVWGGYQSRRYRAACAVFDSAEQIENVGALTPAQMAEYDGKTVCFFGALTVTGTPADPLTGVTVPGALALTRRTSMYQYSLSDDSVVTDWFSYQLPNVNGKNGERYENPVFPAELGGLTLLCGASVGPVKLADAYARAFTASYPYVASAGQYSDYEADRAFDNAYGLTPEGGGYGSGDPDDPQLGDLRVRYEYIPAEAAGGRLVFFGRLSGGVLGEEDPESAFMMDGCETFAQAREKAAGDRKDNANGLFLFAGLNAVAAVVVFGVKTLRNRKRGAEG